MRRTKAGLCIVLLGLVLGSWALTQRVLGVAKVEVVGSRSHDFGTTQDPMAVLEHEFRLRNAGTRALEIEDVRAGCGCLEATAARSDLPPGGEVAVRVAIDLRGIVGAKDTAAYVVFSDPEVPPVFLHVKAFVEPQFAVSVEPAVITVPRNIAPGTVGQETLEVTEYLSHAEAYQRETAIAVEKGDHGADLKILHVEPWEALGWTFTRGFVRTTEVTVSYRLPSDWTEIQSAAFTLLFTKPTSGESADKTL
ncbi:MAG: DUF1573 domain-containing protein, partial [bacterium]